MPQNNIASKRPSTSNSTESETHLPLFESATPIPNVPKVDSIARNAGNPVEGILSLLEKVTKIREGQWQALCPAHEDHKPSLTISLADDGKVLLKCHAGCDTEKIVGTLGLTMADLFPKAHTTSIEFTKKRPTRKTAAKSSGQNNTTMIYDYKDGDGNLLYQVVRYIPKDFRQRRPDGNGGYIWSMDGVERVLYNLPGLLQNRKDEWVFIVEGEKDSDRLNDLGLLSTTNSGGAGKWNKIGDLAALSNRRIAIIPDSDDAGKRHAISVALSLQGIALETRIVYLDEVINGVNDVSEWLDESGHSQQELLDIVDGAPKWPGEPWGNSAATSELPEGFDFPVDALPAWMANMVNGVSHVTQTPKALAGCVGLGVLSLIAGKRSKVISNEDWSVQTNLYIAAAMESGTRKSSVFSKMKAPLESWELSRSENDIQDHIPTRLLASCVTPEGLVRLMYDQNGSIGVFTSEGDELVSMIRGKYQKNGEPNVNIYLNAYDGNVIREDRADRARKPAIIRKPALTITVTMQPVVLDSLMNHKLLGSRGLLARFLLLKLPSYFGKRATRPNPIPASVKTEYKAFIEKLLESYTEDIRAGRILRMSLTPEAESLFDSFQKQNESDLAPDQRFGNMTYWAARRPALVLKIAGLLHVAETTSFDTSAPQKISEKTMEASITLVEYFTDEMERMPGFSTGLNAEDQREESLRNAMLSISKVHVAERDLYRYLGIRSSELRKLLKSLQSKGLVRQAGLISAARGPGRKPCARWLVSPELLGHSVQIVNSVEEGAR